MAQYIKTEEGYKELATITDDKMDKFNPTGIGSFSMNRKAGTVVGVDSHAEGYQATASGNYSHAEGYRATASGYSAHAEGNRTTASGSYSHTEGYITTASGDDSHAEGDHTIASGYDSHAQGKYNIKDTSNKYADIIGNGTSTKRSNAATVDWEGNAWFAGDVYTGSTSGTNKDEGSKKLATEEYVNGSIAAGGIQPYIVTLELDEDGNFSFPGTTSDMEDIEAIFYSGRRVLTIIDDSNRTKRLFVLTSVSRTSDNLFVEELRFTAAYPDVNNAYSVVDEIVVRYSGSSITVIREKASILLSDINDIKANAIVPTSIYQGSFGYWYVDGNSAFGVISANPGKHAIAYVSSIYGNLPLYLSSISDTEIIYKNTASDGSWVGFKIGANSSLQDCGPIAGTLNVKPVFEARLFLDSSIPYRLNLESGIAVSDLVKAFDEGQRVIARLCVNEDDNGYPFEMQMYIPGSSRDIPNTIMFAPCSISSASIDGEIQGMSTVIIGFEDGNWYFSGFALDAIGGAPFETPYTVPFEVNAMYCETFDELVSATHDFRWRAYIYKGDHKLYLQVPEYSPSVTPNILHFTGITEPDGSGISSCVWTTVQIPVSPSNVILWDDSTLPTFNDALDTWGYYKLNKDSSGVLRVYDVFNEQVDNLGVMGRDVIEYQGHQYLFNNVDGASLRYYYMDFNRTSEPKFSTITINRRLNDITVTDLQPLWGLATESEVNNAVDDIFKT